jgi:hypothetical protein
MKVIAVSLICLSVVQFSNALSKNYQSRELSCSLNEKYYVFQIFKFGLVIQTLTEGSKAFVKNGYLTTTYSEFPTDNYTTSTPMKIINQDTNYVHFEAHEAYNKPFTIKLDKKNFTAQIFQDGNENYTCQEVK